MGARSLTSSARATGADARLAINTATITASAAAPSAGVVVATLGALAPGRYDVKLLVALTGPPRHPANAATHRAGVLAELHPDCTFVGVVLPAPAELERAA